VVGDLEHRGQGIEGRLMEKFGCPWGKEKGLTEILLFSAEKELRPLIYIKV